MKNKFVSKFNLSLTSAAILAATIIGCGKSDETKSTIDNAGPAPISCPNGWVANGLGCMPNGANGGWNGNVYDSCAYYGGVKESNICRVEAVLAYANFYNGRAYKINGTGNYSQALSTGFSPVAGDKIIHTASGKWGTSSSCDTGVDGVRDGTVQMHDGKPMAWSAKIYGSSEFVTLGASTTYTVLQPGILYLGFNAATDTGNVGVACLSSLVTKVQRCYNSSNQITACP